ncbi:hypothetical protein C6P40_001745 [Pichia californica]|uniref:1,3-beta-glucanosyltransferase n=1 Tax=Pichia californica TaxID=460514 RepID=A0A9P7BFQ1_9ASCO|nr:hypothetical protein C6P42_000890 [[Candida] californica]KAG0687874.1 hypothetical protein C6P40_001745 [[Candida] californica]
MKFSTFIPFLPFLLESATALDPIVIKNNTFYIGDSDERFYIRGVDYQPGGSSNLTDPLGDPEICERDIPYFTELGLNTIRVYSLDNTLNHTECMNKLQDAGIYVILDVNTPNSAISRSNPSCSYNLDYMTEVFATVDSFASFNNTLGFFAANELVNNEATFQVSPYIKAVTRDIKQYIAAQNYRTIPVGYSAADVAEIRYELAHYLNCGDIEDERIDMLGVNDYSWCGHSSYIVSGYNSKVSSYSGYSLPIFMSEYGCNEVVDSRPFTEVQVIYSTLMSSVFSGGLVYEYFEESNNYGLVNVSGSNVTPLTDFYNLQSMLNSTTNPTGDGGALHYNYSSCPTGLNFSIAVPDQPSGLTALIKSGPNGNNYGFEADTLDSCDDDDDDDITSSSSFYSSSFISSSLHSSSMASSSYKASVVTSSKDTTLITSSIISTSSTHTSSVVTSTSSVSSISSTSKNDAAELGSSNSFMSLIAIIAGILYF